MSVLQARRTVQLAADAGSQPSDLLVRRFPIALDRLAADALAGYEYLIVVMDRVKIRCGAEARDILIREAGDVLVRFEVGVLATPGVVGIGDAADVFGGQLAVGARHHVPKPTGVDEQHLIEPGSSRPDPGPDLAELSNDDAVVLMHYSGRVQPVPGKASIALIASVFETGNPRYFWINKVQAVGKGVLSADWTNTTRLRNLRAPVSAGSP